MSIRSRVNAPALDQRVEFQRKRIERDSDGRTRTEWYSLGVVWARVDGRKVDQSRREPNHAGGLKTMHDYDVWVRSDVFTRLGLVLMDRILWNGRIFDIVDIPDQQLRGNLIAVFCRYGSSDG